MRSLSSGNIRHFPKVALSEYDEYFSDRKKARFKSGFNLHQNLWYPRQDSNLLPADWKKEFQNFFIIVLKSSDNKYRLFLFRHNNYCYSDVNVILSR